MALIDIALARLGAKEGKNPLTLSEFRAKGKISSSLNKIMKRRGIARTSDFRRIEALSRRVWQDDVDEDFARALSEFVKTPDGEMLLYIIQAAALQEIHDEGGAFLPISVGGGKSLITLLADVVVGASRPVLFVPAALREQTKRFVIPQMRKHWRLSGHLKVHGYSELSLARNDKMLDILRPNLIILDECHYLKNKKAGRTKRLTRYMKEHPETVVVALSGTVSNRSLRDYHHIVKWCLGEENSPLPKKWMELCEWADAIDEGVGPAKRLGPGAIRDHFCENGENVRQGYRRRLTDTPGVIASGADELGISLQLYKRSCELSSGALSMIRNVRNFWEDPNGGAIAEAVDIWRIVRQLSQGFWYQWQPPGPPEWLKARKAWKQYVRHTLAHNRRQLDTELQVWNECAALENAVPEWVAWNNIKSSFKPNPVPTWVDDSLIEDVARWVKAGPGIIWVEHTAVGERIEETLGIPYFGSGKKASFEILEASGPICASIRAHGTGKNLQQWNRNLITSTPTSGKTYEQLLGRTHRNGQKADEVRFDIYQHQPELAESFKQALRDALYLEDSLGNRQRLNYADITFRGELNE